MGVKARHWVLSYEDESCVIVPAAQLLGSASHPMHHTLSGPTVSALRSPTSDSQHGNFTFRKLAGIKATSTSLLKPSDPVRQAKRLPIKVVKMLTAHSGHLLHPEYLQPLTSAPVSIEVGYISLHTTHSSLSPYTLYLFRLCIKF